MTTSLQRECVFIILAGILLSFILVSCSSNGANDQGEIFIEVVDAPANYQQINIVVDRISIHQTGAVGWTFINTSPVKFDLLTLINGHSAQLVLSKVPAGTYDEIKIIYGTCTVTTEGIEHLLNLDASIQNGHSILGSFQIVDGQQFQLMFDYDAYNSVSVSGVFFNNYYFKPKIRVQNTSLSGWITGNVRDSSNVVSAKITTYTGLDSVTTYNETTFGSFQLSGLPERTYTVIVIPDNPLFINDTISGIVVTRQQPTNLGAIQLKYK